MTIHTRRGSAVGAIITVILVFALAALGVYLFNQASASPTPTPSALATTDDAPTVVEPARSVPRLDAAGPYPASAAIIDISISEYAGYAGLIAANGGRLEANPDSAFARNHGFQVRLSRAEADLFSDVNAGKLAALATTVDTLAVMGRQFQVSVPVLLGFSRGADALIVRNDIPTLNALKGQVVSAAQFNETDFLLRYLASEAGIPIQVLSDLGQRPPADRIGVVYCADAFAAADLFAAELRTTTPRLAGCIGWAPRIYEVLDASKAQARLLVSNRNLLLVADILVFNKAWAQANGPRVAAIVQEILIANQQVRDNPEGALPMLHTAFGWNAVQARAELARVHLANLPENLAFFTGTIDSAGSYGGIFQGALSAYGSALIPNPADPDRFLDLAPARGLEASGRFRDQRIAIAPIRSGGPTSIEGDALLSKDVRFLFLPNSAELDLKDQGNLGYLEDVRRYLQIAPGSTILLRGHVDNGMVETFRKQGGEALVRSMALKAVELSRQRAASVRQALIDRLKLDATRIETVGRGWEEPLGADGDQNRRVEVRWFTVE